MKAQDFPTALQEGRHDPHIFKAVVMAGSPGSGKSTVRNLLFGGHGLKLVDADEIHAAYQKMGKVGDYERYGAVSRKQRETYMDQRLGIIFDTTAWFKPGIDNLVEQLRSLGYDVAMVQVYTPLHTAMERARERAELTGREVSEEDIRKRYEGLQRHTADYAEMFGDHYWFVDNSSSQPNIDVIKRKVLKWLRSPPENPLAHEWIHGAKLEEARKKRVSAGVVITDGERFIIGHPTNGVTWDIPKGGVDPGETHAQAAAREVHEETGLTIRSQDLVHLGVYPYSSEKDLSVFLLRVAKLPPVGTLHCDSLFRDTDGVMRPELDEFRIVSREESRALFKPALNKILDQHWDKFAPQSS